MSTTAEMPPGVMDEKADEVESVQPDLPESRRPPRPTGVGRRLATMALLLLLAAALLAAVPGLRSAVDRIGDISPAWIVAAIALELASELSFVAVFRLFFERVPARDARLLAWTEAASGALLPVGGAGGLAIGGWLMSLTGARPGWIARRSAGLFFLGAAVSGAALIAAGVALIAGAPGPHDFLRAVLPTAIALAATLVLAAIPWIGGSGSRAPRWLSAISVGVEEAERVALSRRAAWRALAALGYLGFDIAVLWIALNALGRPPGVAVVVMAYSIGYAASALPVPGGIGVLDAGIAGALVLYGVNPAHAAAAALIYHAIAFWVPGLGGVYAYVRLRPRLVTPGPAAAPVPAGGVGGGQFPPAGPERFGPAGARAAARSASGLAQNGPRPCRPAARPPAGSERLGEPVRQ